jgi:PAS domain S-box-containing protein
MEEVFGHKKEEVLGKPIFEVVAGLLNEDTESCDMILKGESISRVQKYYFHKGKNKALYFELSCSPLREGSGEIVGGMATIRDISDRIKAEHKLNLSERRFTSINQLSPISMAIFKANGVPIYYNKAFKQFWDLGENTVSTTFRDYNILHDHQLRRLGVMEYINRGFKGYASEIPVISYDIKQSVPQFEGASGSQKFLKGHIYPLKNGIGQVEEVVLMLEDVTEQTMAEHVLSEAHMKFQKFTINLPGVIYEFIERPGERGFFTYISQGCQEMFGYTPEEILFDDNKVYQAIHPEDLPGLVESTQKIRGEAVVWEWEGRIIQEGRIKWVKGRSSPEKEKNGSIRRYGILIDITDQKEAEMQQHQTEQRLELALKGADLGLWDWDIKKNKTVINERFAQKLGYSQAELEECFRNRIDYIHPADQQFVKHQLRAHLKGLTDFYEAEYRFLTKSGRWIWILDRGQVVERDTEGSALRAAGTHLDITDRKVSEKILQESEERYRKLIDFSPLAIAVHCEGKIVFANQQAASLLQAESSDFLLGMDMIQLIHPEHRSTMEKRMVQVLNGEQIPTSEERFVRLDGKVVDVEVVGIPFEYNGRPAIQLVARDITDKKQSEAIIKRNEQLFTQLFENSPMGIVMLDENYRVLQMNQAFEDIFGYGKEEIIGNRLNQVIVPDRLQTEAHDINMFTRNGDVGRLESVRMRKDGQEVPVIIYGVPVMYNERTIGIYGIYVDITARKLVEEELQVRNLELDNFVYKVSHDLRAPLSSILGLVNLSKYDTNNDDPRMYLNMIEDRVKQLDNFISDVLSHSKNLKMEVDISPIDIESVIRECIQDLNYLPNAQSIRHNIEVNGGGLYSDRWRVNEILRNLISNAIKYHNPEEENPFIDIQLTIDSQWAQIVISDNGIGIDKDTIPKVFEMFYRATNKAEGSGIGLYIVRNAIEKLGGNIQVDSALNKGTTFTITIPNHPEHILEEINK